MRTAVAYMRVSTAEQGRSGLGLSAQRESIRQFISANGYVVADEDWFKEQASGKGSDALNKRPVLRAAMRKAKRLKAVIICAKIDRLSRNTHFVTGLLEDKVKFRAADLGDEADNTYLRMLAVFAEREREQIGIRTRDALRAAVRERGIVLGNPTNLHEAGQRGVQTNIRTADDFAARVMPTINKIRASGGARTFREIAEALNARGEPTARGGEWHPESVRRLIERADATKRVPRVRRRLPVAEQSIAPAGAKRTSRFRAIFNS